MDLVSLTPQLDPYPLWSRMFAHVRQRRLGDAEERYLYCSRQAPPAKVSFVFDLEAAPKGA
jgi:hypothetical protein